MLENLFATPVYYGVLSSENVQQISQEINNALPRIRQSNLTNPWQDGVQTTFKYGDVDNNDLEKYNLDVLKTNVFEHVGIYLGDLGIYQPCKVDMLESWFNFGTHGAYQAVHSHSAFTLSAVYYHQTNGQDGDICFQSPGGVHSFFPLWKMANTLGTKESVVYKPQVGKLIIFPSYLLHSVYENRTENERISVAFNFMVKPHI